MLINTWGDVLTRSFQDLWLGIVDFIPSFVVAFIIFILGWIIGAILGKAIAQIINSLKLDNALRSAGFESAVSRAGFKLDSGAFLGSLVKWFVIVVFLVASLDVLGLSQVNIFLQQVVLLFLPKVIVAVLIMLVAVVIAEAMQGIVVGSAKAAHMRSANFLGTLTRWSIWVFAGLASLFHLGVAAAFIQTLFTGIIIALALAFGLSFGIGGQKAAADYLERLRRDVSHR
jgi:hypothetical protein